MSIRIQIARCVWPGKKWDDRYNEGKEKISATFVLVDDWDDRENKEKQFRINVRVDEGASVRSYPYDAKRLLALRKGQTVSVVKMKAKHDYWLLVEYPESLQQLMRDGLALRNWKKEAEQVRREGIDENRTRQPSARNGHAHTL